MLESGSKTGSLEKFSENNAAFSVWMLKLKTPRYDITQNYHVFRTQVTHNSTTIRSNSK